MVVNLTSNFRLYTLFEDLEVLVSFLKAGLLLQNVALNINLCTWTSRTMKSQGISELYVNQKKN